jgi:endoglucanase
MAQAGRIFAAFGKALPGLSDSCRAAAVYAWQWAEKNPSLLYDQTAMNTRYEPKVTTGAYGDKHVEDEWFWAAAELLVTTGDARYYKTVAGRIGDTVSLPSWNNLYLLGYYTLLRHKKQLLPHYAGDLQLMQKKLVRFADGYLQHVDDNAFETVMGQNKKDFIWGSNSVAANQGIVLVNAYLITKEKKYIDYALTNLDYLLGRNATGYCFLTGAGTRSTMYPHHRPSVADGIPEPVPGLMAGGPNPGRQDHCHYDLIEPETAYADTDCAYASNEIAINWNAPLVYLAGALEALQYEAGYAEK